MLKQGAAAEAALVDAREFAALAVREEAAARAVLEAAKRAAAEGELLSEEEQQEIAMEVRFWTGVMSLGLLGSRDVNVWEC